MASVPGPTRLQFISDETLNESHNTPYMGLMGWFLLLSPLEALHKKTWVNRPRFWH